MLSLGGYTPLWVAPEYSGRASFNALQSMDVFSFGLLVWAVVLNGTVILSELVANYDATEALLLLQHYKEPENLLKLARGSVQMQGYCGDIDMKAFMEILENTLGAPLSRKLEPTLTILKK